MLLDRCPRGNICNLLYVFDLGVRLGLGRLSVFRHQQVIAERTVSSKDVYVVTGAASVGAVSEDDDVDPMQVICVRIAVSD